MADTANQISEPPVDQTRIRYLTPDMCKIHLGTHGALHVTVMDERIYGGVYAAYAFPVAHPNQYISLIHHIGGASKDIEIGVIRDLSVFPEEQACLIRQALTRRYFVHQITRIFHIGWKYGFLWLDVETDKGPVNFFMHYQVERAFDYGGKGKVLLDVDENRYLIPDVGQLTPKERAEFTRYIYW